MDSAQPAAPAPAPSKLASLASPKALKILAISIALGVGSFAATYFLVYGPARATAKRRYDAQMAMLKLYDLQTAYRAARGTYAGSLEELLASSPEGPALRAELAANADINTLTVVGDEEKFKLEANVLDSERTLIKIKGPLEER
jgi:hypothetical protein